jgi:4-aminobutyrate aminotransferase-like enzyme
MTRDEIIRKYKEYLFPSVSTYFAEPLVTDHASMQYLWDADGKQYLDFFGGIVTISVGHANPKVTDKIIAQTKRLQHASTVLPNEAIVALAEKIAEITPGKLSKSYFTNSGTEANETAVQLARVHTGRYEIVALRHAYAGRSQLAQSITGQNTWRKSLPGAFGVVHAMNPYCYRCPLDKTYPSCDVACANDVEAVIQTTTSGRIAAFMADEVQTGWGRTGKKWFGIEHWEVVPDMITAAKSLGNGVPIGATFTTPEIAGSFKGLQISTFGGNPVSCTAARAVIQVIEEENLLENAATTGKYFQDGLRELQNKHALIGDVRGMGLMQAIELVKDRETKEPAPEATNQFMEECRREGLLIGKGGMVGNVIRLSPPLNISKADVDVALRTMDKALSQVGKQAVAVGA